MAPGDLPDQSEALRNIGALEAVEDRARKRGEDATWVRLQIEAHEKRLNAQNGNIRRMAEAQEATNDSLDQLRVSVEQSTAVAKARADTAAELAEATAKATVDKRTFIFTALACSTGIASAVIAGIALFVG